MPRDNITHIAFDYGVLDFLGLSKTKTTLCNKRVGRGKIDNRHATCQECLAIDSEATALRAILQDENPSLTGHINGQSIDHL